MMGKMLILQILLILPELRTSPIDFPTQQNKEQHLTLTHTLCQRFCYIFVFLFRVLALSRSPHPP